MRHPRLVPRQRTSEPPAQAAALRALLASPSAGLSEPYPTPHNDPEVIVLASDNEEGPLPQRAAAPRCGAGGAACGAWGDAEGSDPKVNPASGVRAVRAYVGAYSAARLGGGVAPAGMGAGGGGSFDGGWDYPDSDPNPDPGVDCAGAPWKPTGKRPAARASAEAGGGEAAQGPRLGFGQGRLACDGGQAGGAALREPPWWHRLPDFVPVAALRGGVDPRCAMFGSWCRALLVRNLPSTLGAALRGGVSSRWI